MNVLDGVLERVAIVIGEVACIPRTRSSAVPKAVIIWIIGISATPARAAAAAGWVDGSARRSRRAHPCRRRRRSVSLSSYGHDPRAHPRRQMPKQARACTQPQTHILTHKHALLPAQGRLPRLDPPPSRRLSPSHARVVEVGRPPRLFHVGPSLPALVAAVWVPPVLPL